MIPILCLYILQVISGTKVCSEVYSDVNNNNILIICIHLDLFAKYSVGLKTLLQHNISEPLQYNFKWKKRNPSFLIYSKTTKSHKFQAVHVTWF